VDLTLVPDVADLRERVAVASAVVPVGARTQWEVGGAPPAGVEVRAPGGVIAYDPADLTVTVGAGLSVRELGDVLGAAGQECPLDPRDPDATVGGVLAVGLSGWRRLAYGPLRNRVLEVRFVTADGRVVRGGGPTVKNVTGYDLPRLLVGSFGTVGVLAHVILRCQPRAAVSAWSLTDRDPDAVRRDCFRPACIAWDGQTTHVLLEGHSGDVDAQERAAGLRRVAGPPRWPAGPHRGRISVVPARLHDLRRPLDAITGLAWMAEVGVGTVHVAADDVAGLAAARAAATAVDGWLLREAGGTGLDGFGTEMPNQSLMRRVRQAFDPSEKLNRGRLPL
jgi:glycolate oxidase FAD binding subunit